MVKQRDDTSRCVARRRLVAPAFRAGCVFALACCCVVALSVRAEVVREEGWGVVPLAAAAPPAQAPEARSGGDAPLRERALDAALRDAVERVIRAVLRRHGAELNLEAALAALGGGPVSYVVGYRVLEDWGVVSASAIPDVASVRVEVPDPPELPEPPDPARREAVAGFSAQADGGGDAYVIAIEVGVRLDLLRMRLTERGFLAPPRPVAAEGTITLVLEGQISYPVYREIGAALRGAGASVEELSFHRSGVELQVEADRGSTGLYDALRGRLEPEFTLELRAAPPGELRLRVVEWPHGAGGGGEAIGGTAPEGPLR